MPTIAANAYLHQMGESYCSPNNELGYIQNFLYMIDSQEDPQIEIDSKLVKILNQMFILGADEDQNVGTSFMRHLASSGVDVYSCVAGACGALYGIKNGGASQQAIQMLRQIGDPKNVSSFLAEVKAGKKLLFGFGHRIFKKGSDPRTCILKNLAKETFELLGHNYWAEVAFELEKQASEDEYFKKRGLLPNGNFYTGIIYEAMGFPDVYFPVLFCIPRVVGWLAHWNEFLQDSEQKIIRPRQNYQGHKRRDYVPRMERPETKLNF